MEKDRQLKLFFPEMVTEPLAKNPFERISNIVYSVLEQAILSSRLAPGQRLNATKIAAALDVSATPVREAIEQLSQNGLVTVEQTGKYSSYRVFDLSANSIRDLFIARKAIESTAACLCAQKNWRVDIAALGHLAEQFQRTLSSFIHSKKSEPDVSLTAELDQQFHQLLVNSTHNAYLIEMYSSLGKKLRYLSLRTNQFLVSEQNTDNLLLLGNQHICIYRAVKYGFPDTAKSCMDEHIDFCLNSCLQNRNLSLGRK